jgi:CubicO group peptidase (beta-lactamase class C family)
MKYAVPLLFLSTLSHSIENESINSLVQTAFQSQLTPALGVWNQHQGQTRFQRALGKRAIQFDTPVELNDQWHLGSDTKAMTAYLIAHTQLKTNP